MTPTKGLRFNHRRVLSSIAFDGKTPQMYEVTRIASGWVFYRPVYDYGTREVLGVPEKCQLATFPRIAEVLA